MISTTMNTPRMDAIKKKMEKLANETNEAEMRIAHFEDIKAANELEVAVINIQHQCHHSQMFHQARAEYFWY